MKNDPFTVTERIKTNPLEFVFYNFKEIAENLRGALISGTLKRGKKYKLIIKEV